MERDYKRCGMQNVVKTNEIRPKSCKKKTLFSVASTKSNYTLLELRETAFHLVYRTKRD